MAVRQNQPASEDQAPAQSGGGIFQNSIIFMALLFGLGFVANNYLIASQVAHDTTTEYKGYQEAVKDVR
jgi:hypothetical protein